MIQFPLTHPISLPLTRLADAVEGVCRDLSELCGRQLTVDEVAEMTQAKATTREYLHGAVCHHLHQFNMSEEDYYDSDRHYQEEKYWDYLEDLYTEIRRQG